MLDLLRGVVKRQGPVGVQAVFPELAVERLDGVVFGEPMRLREVESDFRAADSQVEVAGDEIGTLIARIIADNMFATDLFVGSDDILPTIAETGSTTGEKCDPPGAPPAIRRSVAGNPALTVEASLQAAASRNIYCRNSYPPETG